MVESIVDSRISKQLDEFAHGWLPQLPHRFFHGEVGLVEDWIYSRFYARVEAIHGDPFRDLRAQPAEQEDLGGWRLLQRLEDGAASLVRGPVMARTRAGEWFIRVDGTAVIVRRIFEIDQSTLFAWFRSRRPSSVFEAATTIRFYLTLNPEHVLMQLQRVVAALKAETYPWALKTVVDPRSAGRLDATVVYVSEQISKDVLELLTTVIEHDAVRDGSPPFTLPVAPGVAVASDPGGQVSFGSMVAATLAAAVVSGGALWESWERACITRGVDPTRPWRGTRRSDPWRVWASVGG